LRLSYPEGRGGDYLPYGPKTDEALAELTQGGQSKTAAIKAALPLAAQTRRRDRQRAEGAALAADRADLAEIRAVREDMDALRAW